MKETPKVIKRFLEDQVLGEFMSDKKICKYILKIFLSFKIKEIYYPEKQKEVKDPKHRERKDVRFDILVEDYEHNLYDVEAQTTDKKDLGCECGITQLKWISAILSIKARPIVI